MNGRRTQLIPSILCAVALAAGTAIAGPDVSYPKRAESGRAAVTRPSAAVPGTIRHRAPEAPASAQIRGTAPRSSYVERHATNAAAWAVERLLATEGRRAYFRVGFHAGLREALSDERIGLRDFREGRRAAQRDTDALAYGRQLGRTAALDAATHEAALRVEQQFRDLDREPRFWPQASGVPFATPVVGIATPTLRDLMAEYPIRRHAMARENAPFVRDWTRDAWALYGHDRPDTWFDRDWADAERAFRIWRQDANRSAAFRSLRTEDDRRRFRETFLRVFAGKTAASEARLLDAVFQRGFEEGWDYGAFIRSEWNWRCGYREGFIDLAQLTAQATFHRVFPRRFEVEYTREFDRWSTEPVTEIRSVDVSDATGDGVFEPGEDVLVFLEVVNFGGVPARLPVRIAGASLTRDGSGAVRVPARGVGATGAPVPATLRGSLRVRQAAEFDVHVGDLTESATVRIARPLAFVAGTPGIERDDLGGTVRMTWTVRNISTEPRAGGLVVRSRDFAGFEEHRRLRTLAPGESRTERVFVDGLSSLAMISGRLGFTARLESEGVEQDVAIRSLGETASDLDNRALLVLMQSMARDGAAESDLLETRELLMRRLRKDWSFASHTSGNPYKQDFRDRSARTALGELVVTVRDDPFASGSPVFAGLSGDVHRLAGDLPGWHPFLRKYVRRLAQRLP